MGIRDDYARAFGENLVVLRKMAGYPTQPDLANALERAVSAVTIGRWERGERLPDAYELLRLGEVLDATPDELLRPRPLSGAERELLRRGARVVDRARLRERRGG